jgi:hypothetical protein
MTNRSSIRRTLYTFTMKDWPDRVAMYLGSLANLTLGKAGQLAQRLGPATTRPFS